MPSAADTSSSLVELLCSLSASISLVLGLSLNGLLCFLMRLRRSNPEIRVYRVLLMQTCMTDICLLVITELTQPVITNTGPEMFITLLGPGGRRLSNPWAFWLYALWFFALNFSIMGLTVQFLYRYFVICSKTVVTQTYRLYFRLLAIFTAVLLLLMAAIFVAFYPPADKQEIRLPFVADDCIEDCMAQVAFYSKIGNVLIQLAATGFYLLVSDACYVIIIVCFLRIRKFLVANAVKLNEREERRKMMVNKQISLMLLLQCLLPLYCMSLMISICVLLLLQFDWPVLKQLELLAFVPLHWLPLLNPVVTILTVKDYRRFICRVAGLNKIFSTSVGSTMAVAVVGGQPRQSSQLQQRSRQNSYNGIVPKAQQKQLELLAFVPLHWLPLLNPVVTMFTVKDYRRFVFRVSLLNKIFTVNTISNGATTVAVVGLQHSQRSRQNSRLNNNGSAAGWMDGQ